MSSERHFSSKPYRPARKKKSYWKPVLFLVLLGGVWFGYIQYWPTIEGWFKPTIHEVHSQTQAMGHLQDMLASWNGSDAELAQMASSVDKQVEWMNSPEARDSFAWLLAVEMDRRGMLKESEPMLAALLGKKLAASSSMTAEDNTRLLGVSLNWAREFARRKHDAVAEKLYEVILKNTPEDQVSIRLACLEPLIHYAYDQARFERFSALCKQAVSPVMRSMLNKPEDVKSMVKILLLQDTLPDRTTGLPGGTGSAIARELLTKFRLTANPDMGRIILNELKMPLNTRRKYSQEELKAMADQLEAALICFRAAETEMDCTPETMLALARVRMQMGDLREASRLLSRAEGAAMTLGVDAPRILSGSSLSQDIASMRSQLEKYSKAEALVKRAYEDVNVAAAFLKARDYDQAVKYLEQAMKVARENTTFVQALQPVILNLQAEISAGREQWALSESQYGKLIAEWDALTPEDKEKLRNNLASIQLGELYNEIHRNWAGVCLKQKRTTEARRVLGKIGEVPAEEPERPASRRRRR